MKKALILIMLMATYPALCQEKMSKKEKKALVKQAKSLKSNPEKMKALNEELASLKSEVGSARQEATQAKEEVTTLNNRIEVLENELAQAKAKPAPVERKVAAAESGPDIAGLRFKVQIGGFRKRDLSEFDDSKEGLVDVEVNEAGIQEIALGSFDSYQKANEYKKHLRAMGLKDSWIVPYQDGKRVPLKDVVDQLDIK